MKLIIVIIFAIVYLLTSIQEELKFTSNIVKPVKIITLLA